MPPPGIEYFPPGDGGRAAVGRIDGIGDLEVIQADGGGTQVVINTIMGSAHCGFPSASPAHLDESKISGYELIFYRMNFPDQEVPAMGTGLGSPWGTGGVEHPSRVYRVLDRTVGRTGSTGAPGAEPVDDGTAENLLTNPITLDAGAWWLLLSVWCKVPYRDSWEALDGPAPYAGDIGVGRNGMGSYRRPFMEGAISPSSPSLAPHPCNNYAAMMHRMWPYILPTESLQSTAAWQTSLYWLGTQTRYRMFERANANGLSGAGGDVMKQLLDQHIVGFRVNELTWPAT